MLHMKEFEIYVPSRQNDGTLVELAEIESIKGTLMKAFGGYTHLQQRSKGAWKMAGTTFHDDVTIIRVLDDGSADFDMPKFKKSLERSLKQDTVLIVEREVSLVS
jgi:hypothetical protein